MNQNKQDNMKFNFGVALCSLFLFAIAASFIFVMGGSIGIGIGCVFGAGGLGISAFGIANNFINKDDPKKGPEPAEPLNSGEGQKKEEGQGLENAEGQNDEIIKIAEKGDGNNIDKLSMNNGPSNENKEKINKDQANILNLNIQ